MPEGIERLNCNSCSLKSRPKLPSTLMELECADNLLVSLPSLTVGLTYIHCSRNKILKIGNLPRSLMTIDCRESKLSAVPVHPTAHILFSKNEIRMLDRVAGKSVFQGNKDDNFELKFAAADELMKTDAGIRAATDEIIQSSEVKLENQESGLIGEAEQSAYRATITLDEGVLSLHFRSSPTHPLNCTVAMA
jgi:Leucine-rich repeat (LRR) protein